MKTIVLIKGEIDFLNFQFDHKMFFDVSDEFKIIPKIIRKFMYGDVMYTFENLLGRNFSFYSSNDSCFPSLNNIYILN